MKLKKKYELFNININLFNEYYLFNINFIIYY